MEVLAVVLGDRKDSGNRSAFSAAAAQAVPCPSASIMHYEASDVACELPSKSLSNRSSVSGSFGGNYISLWAGGSSSMRRSLDEPATGSRAFMRSVSLRDNGTTSQILPPQLARTSTGQITGQVGFNPGSSIPSSTAGCSRSSSGALQHSPSMRTSGEFQPVSPTLGFSPSFGRASMDGATSIALAASRRLQAEVTRS